MTLSATIVWFRRDLRIADNPALLDAAARGGPVAPVYLPDWESRSAWRPGPAASSWLTSSLRRLSGDLEVLGASLRLVPGEPETALPRLAHALGADAVVWNALYEPESRRLDQEVQTALGTAGIEVEIFASALLFEPEGHLSAGGRPYVQFGAFWRSCLALPDPRRPLPAPARLPSLPPGAAQRPAGADEHEVVPIPGEEGGGAALSGTGQRSSPLAGIWQPGEEGAQRRLERFLDEALDQYDIARDFPGVEGVSRLSPHLHFGEISPHQVWHAVGEREAERETATRSGRPPRLPLEPEGTSDPAGAAAFLRQLGWREFAHYLLQHFPSMPTEPFRPEFSRFPWEDDFGGLEAWKEGRTGYPLVDAGMRQLATEGWMHNRVRMVVASFLTKDLLIPWQHGAAWFWETLVDADLANNTLGWQWTAGSGPDAAPYFRIYNPMLQRERFDPASEYVKRWLPEDHLSSIPPVVDHRAARLRALAAFRQTRSGASGPRL